MKVSIVVPNYNGKKFLKVCLDMLSKQTFNLYETILVDNSSCDGSIEYIKQNYPDIKIISLDQNYGFSRAVNEGIKASIGEYIVLLNNDTEVTQEWLEKLYNCIEQDKNIFSCSSRMIQYYNRDAIDDAGDQYTLLGWAYKRGDGKHVSQFSNNKEIFSSCAGAVIYRKKILDQIGYFDESFFAYMEDVDIGYRAKIFGYKNMYCSKADVYHVGSGTSGSKHNAFKVKLASRNNIYVIYKNMPLIQLAINMPFIILGIIIKYLFFMKKGFGKQYMQGIIEALNTLKKVNRIKYNHKNFKNYIKIQWELIKNTFLMFSSSK